MADISAVIRRNRPGTLASVCNYVITSPSWTENPKCYRCTSTTLSYSGTGYIPNFRRSRILSKSKVDISFPTVHSSSSETFSDRV